MEQISVAYALKVCSRAYTERRVPNDMRRRRLQRPATDAGGSGAPLTERRSARLAERKARMSSTPPTPPAGKALGGTITTTKPPRIGKGAATRRKASNSPVLPYVPRELRIDIYQKYIQSLLSEKRDYLEARKREWPHANYLALILWCKPRGNRRRCANGQLASSQFKMPAIMELAHLYVHAFLAPRCKALTHNDSASAAKVLEIYPEEDFRKELRAVFLRLFRDDMARTWGTPLAFDAQLSRQLRECRLNYKGYRFCRKLIDVLDWDYLICSPMFWHVNAGHRIFYQLIARLLRSSNSYLYNSLVSLSKSRSDIIDYYAMTRATGSIGDEKIKSDTPIIDGSNIHISSASPEDTSSEHSSAESIAANYEPRCGKDDISSTRSDAERAGLLFMEEVLSLFIDKPYMSYYE